MDTAKPAKYPSTTDRMTEDFPSESYLPHRSRKLGRCGALLNVVLLCGILRYGWTLFENHALVASSQFVHDTNVVIHFLILRLHY